MNELKNIIENNYALKILKIKPISFHTLNKTFILETNKGKLFGKQLFKFRQTKKDHFLVQLEIVRHLQKKKEQVIVPIKNKKDEWLTEEGENYIILYPYHKIDPVTSESKKINFEKIPELLARFHEATKDFKTKREFSVKSFNEKNAIEEITKFTEIPSNFEHDSIVNMARKEKTLFAKKVLQDMPLIKEAIIRTLKILWKVKLSKEQLLHYNFSPNNIFFQEGKLLAISDFDFAHFGSIELDLVRAANFWTENDDGSINLTKFKIFISAYQKHNKNIKKDWNIYYGLLLFMILRRMAFAADYVLNKKSDVEWLYNKGRVALEQLMQNNLC